MMMLQLRAAKVAAVLAAVRPFRQEDRDHRQLEVWPELMTPIIKQVWIQVL